MIYGVSKYKTHTKLLMIIRKEGEKVTRYVHIGSGNYNEQTSRLYTDVSLLTTNDVYGHDVSEFFNVITGHSQPDDYEYLITAPKDMRQQLIHLIREEVKHAKKGHQSGIVMKMNSLEDKEIIDEFYKAAKAGVPIRFIVRGICCLRPGRPGLSDNIEVRSIVGEYLEHTRLFYFHNGGEAKVYAGSADIMVRSFDRRIEALFLIVNPQLKARSHQHSDDEYDGQPEQLRDARGRRLHPPAPGRWRAGGERAQGLLPARRSPAGQRHARGPAGPARRAGPAPRRCRPLTWPLRKPPPTSAADCRG